MAGDADRIPRSPARPGRTPEFRALPGRAGPGDARAAELKHRSGGFWPSTVNRDSIPWPSSALKFALSEALPLYSGGLGNVAGDYLQGRARPRRADDRRRAPVPARVLSSGDRRSRSAARVLPLQRHPLPAHRSGARRARRMGARSPSAARAAGLAPRLGRSSGGRSPLSSGLERSGESPGRSRDHCAALRRGPRGANPPGDGARDRRLATPPRAMGYPPVFAT